ncbi:polymorphic toxin type 8 domain-containing protein [Psychrobacter sp. FDAARGOS_221]|uniref:polymorphic toxin type 8 domain-containing protein n=1 Tax=Psychrobacter sp. FDAARGOS_221 TaxID=1975705 RepID=UPI000C9F143A|nr:type IV secretion protein Rhs [Psychrobacter sp. FDAARGOS_221]
MHRILRDGLIRLSRSTAGKQQKTRALAIDSNQPEYVRGWVRNEIRRVERLKSQGITRRLRIPPGFDLAHWRGHESKKGFDYTYTDLNTKGLHRTQHRHDNKGRKNKPRSSNKCLGRTNEVIRASRL